MNQRNCGGTERLTPTLYNSGLSDDYRAVLDGIDCGRIREDFFCRVLDGRKPGDENGGRIRGSARRRNCEGVAAVCPALDLSACADALEERAEFFVSMAFCAGIDGAVPQESELFPGRYTRNGFGPIRTVREFDDAITAPCFGYKDAEEYYEAAGAKKVIGKVRGADAVDYGAG